MRDTTGRQKPSSPTDYGLNSGPNDPPPGPPPPLPAARNVTIKVYANGTWKLTWQDFRAPFQMGADANPVESWVVGFVTESMAGPRSGDTSWVKNCQSKAVILGAVGSSGQGSMLNYFQSDTNLGDGYALVWAVDAASTIGPPSTPLRVLVSTTTGAIPGDPRGIGLSRTYKRVRLTDNANAIYTMNVDPWWYPPANTTEFGGMEVYVTGRNGSSAAYELGSMCPWNGTSGAHNYYSITTPDDAAYNTHAVTFTNGSAAMLRSSGNNFTAAEAGHFFAAYAAGPDDYTSVYMSIINTFTDANHAAQVGPFPYANGTYQVKVFNVHTFYYNSVSNSGVRRANPLAAPYLTI